MHASLRFFTQSGRVYLLYALFICKQELAVVCRCMRMFTLSHATVCFCMFLDGYRQTPEPVNPGRLAQIDKSCVDVP